MAARGWLLVAALYLGLPLYQAWDYVATQPFAGLADNLNYVSSIFAYNWLLLNVLIGLKVPVLQSAFPYDLRIRLHVWSTMGLTGLLAWHGLYYFFLNPKFIDPVTWTLLATFAGLLALSLLWIPLPGLRTLRANLLGLVRRSLLTSYDWLKATHKVLFLVLAGLTYLHVVDAKLLGVASPLSTLLFQSLFLVTAAFYLWTRLHNLTLPTLEVLSVVQEGGIVRLALAGHPRLRYRAGQFAFLRFRHPDLRGEEHPFSFTSAHHESRVGFAVRALGDFTAKLSRLKPGDKVKVNGGFGAFRPAAGSHPLALIGSGIGAAPLISILKDLAQTQPEREVVCLLSVNRRDELLEHEALNELTLAMPQLKLRLFVYEEDGLLYGPDLLRRELGQPERYRYFLCSSDRVRSVVVSALRHLGVPGRHLHFEAFSLG